MQFALVLPLLYRMLQPLFPDCLWSLEQELRHDQPGGGPKQVALTFDDGPHPQYTPELLSVLRHYDVKASFFCLGACVEYFPEVCRALYDQGHWIGLHGYDHRGFHRLSAETLKESLEKTQTAIARACGLDPIDAKTQMRDVRPPNGLFTPATLSLLHQWDYRPVMWSVVPEDWVRPGVTVVVHRVMQQVQRGSLIVLHDGYWGGQDVAGIADQIISLLLKQGYEFVLVEEFWRLKKSRFRH
ncbi:chitooligosaccharide deacetylase NodB-like protein [Leptolyngbya sp. 'hensonii']|uniref:polysaccharide deacetylase family protein n=1 Tax=Leptolyngbya sp. 'hensonii' TaxID=1922337 RepID=UPI00094FDCB1|nr:polysaccharide deacetylase family protein [Leptolyngbya sp. 'hensonii']OLP16058.1 chitooligosaccharide deacetylase NodB-like protein [Leptolyngbya sp. 'hensonii']